MRVSTFIGKTIVGVALLNAVAWGVKEINKAPPFQEAYREICQTHPAGCDLGRTSNNVLQASTAFVDTLLIRGLSGVAHGVSFLAGWTGSAFHFTQAKPHSPEAPEPAFLRPEQKKKKIQEPSPILDQ
ncbi:MAG: hypothetical protein WC612_06335 [Bdellovibrionales bacterium]|jgi:hypothetical protein